MKDNPKAKGGLLKYLPRRLRSLPVLGAITVGWLTIVAALLITWPGSLLGFEPGSLQLIVFFASFPLFFLGGGAYLLFAGVAGLFVSSKATHLVPVTESKPLFTI